MDTKYLLLVFVIVQITLVTLTDCAGKNKDKCRCKKSKKRRTTKRPKREFRRLAFNDCGHDPDRPVHFLSVDLTPMPVIVPGRISASIDINVTRPLLTDIGMKVTLSRYLFGIPFTVPCVRSGYPDFDVGSCTYDKLCEKINSSVVENNGCPPELVEKNIPCTCPVDAGRYTMNDLVARIPRLRGVVGELAQGDYKITAELFDWVNKTELGCLEMKWSIKKRRSGWWWGRRRREADED